MYRIGICDDEKSTCSQIEEMVETYLKQCGLDGEIDVFYSGEELKKYYLERNQFDLLFLDIELPGLNGVDVGQYVRQELEDETADIVYISSKTHYAMQLFQCRPLDFLVKPVTYRSVSHVIELMIKRTGLRKELFEYISDRTVRKIQVRNIMYFFSENKSIHMVLNTGEEKCFNGKLDEIMEQLPSVGFLRIHKSYLINHDYVSEYLPDQVRMTNGHKLCISKSQRKEVQDKLMELMQR